MAGLAGQRTEVDNRERHRAGAVHPEGATHLVEDADCTGVSHGDV